MVIYTKTGDSGETSLFGGKRVGKDSCNIESNGNFDELSSILGWVCASSITNKDKQLLIGVQRDLYRVMAVLSGSKTVTLSSLDLATKNHEQIIDRLEIQLPKLHSFILPSGGELSSRFHIARSWCRRAERSLVLFFNQKKESEQVSKENKATMLRYINRLSDLLFMLARKYSKEEVELSIDQ